MRKDDKDGGDGSPGIQFRLDSVHLRGRKAHMAGKILSLAEIAEIERANELGALSLGTAASALYNRWQDGIRDEETAIRLIFLIWYQRSEPDWLTGLSDDLVSADAVISEFGGLDKFSPTSLFTLGYLAHDYAVCLGDEKAWKARSTECFEQATKREPTSALFRSWRLIVGIGDHPLSVIELRLLIPEIHARFHGRGALGAYMEGVLCNEEVTEFLSRGRESSNREGHSKEP